MKLCDRREFLHTACMVVAAHSWLQAFAQDAPVFKTDGQKPVEFQHIRLKTAKLDELRDFYPKVLGLPVKNSKSSLEVTIGPSVIEFMPAESGGPYYHFAFNIPENKLDASMEWLRPRWPIFKNPSTGQEIYNFTHWNAHSCYFTDPAGNILEFIARHTLANAASGKFDTRDILSVSEIAMVAPDLSVIADRLKKDLGVHDYPGTSPQFMPLGNEHGLFILVKTGRTWLGSTRQAEEYPVEVALRGEGSQRLVWDGLPFLVKTI